MGSFFRGCHEEGKAAKGKINKEGTKREKGGVSHKEAPRDYSGLWSLTKKTLGQIE